MNKKLVQKIYAAFKNKDHKTIIDLQTEDVEWSVAASPDKVPWAGRSRGHKGVTNFLKTVGDYLVPEAFGIQHFAETENIVIAVGYQAGHIKATGDHYEYDFVHVWELNNGKVSRLRVYFDSAYVAASVAGEQKTAVWNRTTTYCGDIYQDIQNGWIQYATRHEIVVSEKVSGVNQFHSVVERTIELKNLK